MASDTVSEGGNDQTTRGNLTIEVNDDVHCPNYKSNHDIPLNIEVNNDVHCKFIVAIINIIMVSSYQ